MREKIAELINRQSKGDIAYCRRLTDQILSLLIEEIKKELLTDEEIEAIGENRYDLDMSFATEETDFQVEVDAVLQSQLQKIIKRMEEK